MPESSQVLTTPRLLLRPFAGSDIAAVTVYRGDERVMRFIAGAAETAEEVAAFLQRCASYADRQSQTQFRFAIVLTATGQIIGGSGLDITDEEYREGEIGYHLRADYWGQGFATEAAIALLRFGFEELNLHRLFADCAAENTASARVMQKAGMRQEGHFRENKRIVGQWHDTLLYAMLDREWKATQVPGSDNVS